MNSDIVALQEVGTSNLYKTIDIIVEKLGGEWTGNIITKNNSNCFQNQGIIYKKSKLNLINSSLIENAGGVYEWPLGRYPAQYDVNFIVGNMKIPISFINIHAKAHIPATSQDDYNRRTSASHKLKSLLDGAVYNTKRVVVIGDFNDYLIGTICTTCSSTLSPYKNFIDDVANYKGLTTSLLNPYYSNSTVDNIIISNELFGNYLENSAFCEYPATQTIPNFRQTTSSHYPNSITFRITEIVSIEDYPISSSFQVYPNPTTGIVHIKTENSIVPEVKLFALDGRLLKNIQSTEIDLSLYKAGMYFLHVNNEVVKIVKQ